MRAGWLTTAFLIILLSNCVSAATCGNGKAEAGEECDGSDLRGYFCPNICYFDRNHPKDYDHDNPGGNKGFFECGYGGSLSCSPTCTFISTCHMMRCGDGVVEGVEECDNGVQNSDLTPDACRTDCRLHFCGDGVYDSDEECDDGPGNSDDIPDACRRGCREAYCGDGVVDPGNGEECDVGDPEANYGCHQCRLCYKVTDDLTINSEAKLCTGTYEINDDGQQGIIIVSGSGYTFDCNNAQLRGVQMQMQAPNIDPGLMTAPTVPPTTIKNPSLSKDRVGLPAGHEDLADKVGEPELTTSSTLKTSTTFKMPTQQWWMTTTSLPKATTTTQKPLTHRDTRYTTTTLKDAGETTTTHPRFTHLQPGDTTTTTVVVKFLRTPVYAPGDSMPLRTGTGIRVTGDNIVLLDCDVSNFRYGILLEGPDNVLAHNRACENNQDIKSTNINYGTVNHCDKSVSWSENGNPGCTFECGGGFSEAGQDQQQQETEDQQTEEEDGSGKGLIETVLGFLGI